MDHRDYDKILGVERNADDKAIKTAYRRMARKHHPDVSKGSAARFQEINETYEVLSHPAKRKRYDTLGPDWHRSAETGAGGSATSSSPTWAMSAATSKPSGAETRRPPSTSPSRRPSRVRAGMTFDTAAQPA